MKTKPVNGNIRFLYRVNNSAGRVANAAQCDEAEDPDSAFLPKLREIDDCGPAKC